MRKMILALTSAATLVVVAAPVASAFPRGLR